MMSIVFCFLLYCIVKLYYYDVLYFVVLFCYDVQVSLLYYYICIVLKALIFNVKLLY